MKYNKFKNIVISLGFIALSTQVFAAPPPAHFNGGFHPQNGAQQFHPNNGQQFHANGFQQGNNGNHFGQLNHANPGFANGADRFNNDTININEPGGYHGWNQGPVGFNNGWSNGWNNGYSNGGFLTGVGEAIVGGLAATALYNWIFTPHSSANVAYANGSSGSSSYSSDQAQPPTDDITNNTTNNTVVEDDSNIGAWLLALGALILAGAGLAYYLRRDRGERHVGDEYDDDYYDETPIRRNQAQAPHRDRNNYNDNYDRLEDNSSRRTIRNEPRDRVPSPSRQRSRY